MDTASGNSSRGVDGGEQDQGKSEKFWHTRFWEITYHCTLVTSFEQLGSNKVSCTQRDSSGSCEKDWALRGRSRTTANGQGSGLEVERLIARKTREEGREPRQTAKDQVLQAMNLQTSQR